MNTINTYYSSYRNLKKFVLDNHNILFEDNTRSVLVQVFCGTNSKEYLTSLTKQITRLIPHSQIIGTTTNGEIMNGRVSELKTVISFSAFTHSDIRTCFMAQKEMNSFELGRSIAVTLNSQTAMLLILFSTGTVNSNQILEGLQSVNSHLPVAGGVSGNLNKKQGFVFSKDSITACGAVGVVIESKCLKINQYHHLGWKPIGKDMTITKASGLHVYTIDHVPAFQVYRRYLGVDNKSDKIINFIFPLITNRHGEDIGSAPMVIHDDDSIDFSCSLYEGEKVRFSIGHVDMIIKAIDQLVKRIKKKRAESIFVYSCSLRKGYFQESSEIETLPLQCIAPTAGFFTSGEFYHSNNSDKLLSATMTTLVLSEEVNLSKVSTKKQEEPVLRFEENIDDFVTNNLKFGNIATLRGLTNLVNSVTKELTERTKELEKINAETIYSSTHDALTGLYNRGFYEQEIKQLNSCKEPLCIIMCDVDGLKLINDTLGHRAGDTVLKASANILNSLFGNNNLVARIGGDEFSILLNNCSLSNIKNCFQKLNEAISSYNSENPLIPLSISFGYAACENSFGKTDSLFKKADNYMYRVKLNRSKSIRSGLIKTLIQTLKARDIITEAHSNRIQSMLIRFSEYMAFSPSHISDLQLFAQFHDIGKVGIPDNILFKPGPLTAQERKEIQRHCEIGFRIAQSSTDLLPLADWILKHHEWWNGKGYPFGLSGENIPLECRILAIVDSYDAMTSDRPYRKAMNEDAAINELKRCAGTQFDSALVKKFIASMEK